MVSHDIMWWGMVGDGGQWVAQLMVAGDDRGPGWGL